jgi:hypothetical protein
MYRSSKELTSFALKIGYPESITTGIISEIYESSSIPDSLYSNPFFNIIEKLFENISFKDALVLVKEIQEFSESDLETVQDYYDTSYARLSVTIHLAVLFFWYKTKVTTEYSTTNFWKDLSTSKNTNVVMNRMKNCVIYYLKNGYKKNLVVFADFSINYKSKKSSIPKTLTFDGVKVNVM